ncbi:MAG: class I SAM-dependent methyltransferase [Chloroflexota bacterium]
MKPEVARQLGELNRRFYASLADPFARSRAHPQVGFLALLPFLPQQCGTVLDVGCGNGRFGHFLQQHHPFDRYVGVDFTVELLAKGAEMLPNATFLPRDMSRADCLDGLGAFDLVVCLAAMHHVPGRENRVALLQGMRRVLQPGGRIMLSNWQFMESERQQRKVRDWAEVGLTAADVDGTDYLLTWRQDGFGLRYVAMIDEAETAVMAAAADLQVIGQFRSDGKEGNLSLYTILMATTSADAT